MLLEQVAALDQQFRVPPSDGYPTAGDLSNRSAPSSRVRRQLAKDVVRLPLMFGRDRDQLMGHFVGLGGRHIKRIEDESGALVWMDGETAVIQGSDDQVSDLHSLTLPKGSRPTESPSDPILDPIYSLFL